MSGPIRSELFIYNWYRTAAGNEYMTNRKKYMKWLMKYNLVFGSPIQNHLFK